MNADQGQTQQMPISGAASSAATALNSPSGTQISLPGSQQSTQYQVARILELREDDKHHDELVFDMRDSSPTSWHGSVHVVYHFIGDEAEQLM